MWIDFSALKNQSFRYLYLGQIVSFLGSLMSITVVPLQVYELTHSSAMVGLVSIVELVPMLIAALIGGVLADRLNRKRLLLVCESLMAICILALWLNASIGSPNLVLIFVLSAALQALNGFHRPAMEAMTQAILKPNQYASAAGLNSFKMGGVLLVGPSVAGFLFAKYGASVTYAADFLTFLFSVVMLSQIDWDHVKKEKIMGSFALIQEGFRYVKTRKDILGTYLVDFAAMLFAFPVALFPAMAESQGTSEWVGFYYSALSIGSLLIPFLGGWLSQFKRHGLGVLVGAVVWGVFIGCIGLTDSFSASLAFLTLAGLGDVISAFYRSILWNRTIPNEIRGRMASFEMISYLSGPLLGNARAGYVAATLGLQKSFVIGGVFCVLAVCLIGIFLPQLRKYQDKQKKTEITPEVIPAV